MLVRNGVHRTDTLVSDDQKKTILACEEIETLDRWLDNAVTASTTDELFV